MCRTKPRDYADKIKRHVQYISADVSDENSKIIYENKDIKGPKVILKGGRKKLWDFIDLLRSMEPLNEIVYNPSLCIPIPEKKELWTKKEIFAKLILNKKRELKTNNISFHFDIGYNDVETNAILQLIDDNIFFNGKRRINLLSEHTLEIGITNKVEGRKNCCYVAITHDLEVKKNMTFNVSISDISGIQSIQSNYN